MSLDDTMGSSAGAAGVTTDPLSIGTLKVLGSGLAHVIGHPGYTVRERSSTSALLICRAALLAG